ncbi:MAG TPA: addiction module protein [Gemmataceae bacterium]|nr:addiction module protein [Gemmataceae bacterium]
MSDATEKILQDALKLPLKSRAVVAEKLLESLSDQDGIDAAIDEAERRWQDYKEGRIKAIALEDIFPALANKIPRGKRK